MVWCCLERDLDGRDLHSFINSCISGECRARIGIGKMFIGIHLLTPRCKAIAGVLLCQMSPVRTRYLNKRGT